MPRLRDVPVALRKVGVRKFLWDVWIQITEDNVFTWASALAYSWLLALFPFLIFLLTLLPYIPETQKQQVLGGIDGFVKQLPAETASTLHETIGRMLNEKQGKLMSVGLLLALWTASGGMAATMTALDRCYDIDTDRPFYKQRPLAVVLTAIVATLMLTVVILLPIGGLVLTWLWNHWESLIGSKLPPWMQTLRTAIDIGRWLLGLLLLALVLNVVYYFGCQAKRRFRFLTPGAVFCIVVWVVMGLGFRYYIDRFAIQGYNKTYGAIGGVVILMFLFYLAAIILLIGAEINSEIDHTVFAAPRGTKDFREMERAHLRALKTKRRKTEDEGA